ncbi:MAG: cyclic nucleotide-binding domain-containing protein [Magnetococcales bacterium]|nr:cyclic nucleotide-binding domain-containing protein [Magnetococcales bacterium]MBF0322054.1 cyclic nucleotide-binding domain-containing protein [Magnetococcales bacterium]
MIDDHEFARIHLFRGVQRESIDPVLQTASISVREPGEILLQPGQANEHLYVVLSGTLSVHFENPARPAVRTIYPGDSVGELSLLDRSFATAFVVVQEPARILVLAGEKLWTLIERNGRVASNLLGVLTQWIKSNTRMMVERERRLEKSEGRLRAILNGAVNGILVFNDHGLIESINPAAERMLGESASRMVGRPLGDLGIRFPDFTPEGVPSWLGGNGPPLPEGGLESTVKRRDGTELAAEIFLSEVKHEEGRLFVCIIHDITERLAAVARMQRFSRAAERFVPHRFLQLLGRTSLEETTLGDNAKQKMSVLFSDIRDFTSFSEELPPEQVFRFLNGYLARLEPFVQQHNGVIDKYIGDAIMALFPGSPEDAVHAAIAMLERLTAYNRERISYGWQPIHAGFGINTGSLMIGTIGGAERIANTVVGDVVNLASRVEGLTKSYQTPLLITHHSLFAMNDNHPFSVRFIDRVAPRGTSHPVMVHEVFNADPEPLRTAKLVTLSLFKDAVSLFHLNHLGSALQLFEKCQETTRDDPVVAIYLERARRIANDRRRARPAEEAPVVWQEEMSTGLSILDHATHELLLVAGRFLEGVTANRILEVLYPFYAHWNEYLPLHFAEEESAMLSHGYPECQSHKEAHDRYRGDLDHLRREFSRHSDSENYLGFRLQGQFLGWVRQHLHRDDRDFACFMRGMKAKAL